MAKSYKDKLLDPRWQKKRLEILTRDEFTCKLCSDTETTLHIHHLKYHPNGNPWDISPEYLITYCSHCHYVIEQLKKDKDVGEIISLEKRITEEDCFAVTVVHYTKDKSKQVSIYNNYNKSFNHIITLSSGFITRINKLIKNG